MQKLKRKQSIFIGASLAASIVALYLFLLNSGYLASILDGVELSRQIHSLGSWGPVAVIALMASAIILSPIPSAPIALAAGAAYGHIWGTAIVLIGAEIGALAAFGIARLLGFDLMRRWFGAHLKIGLWGSQSWLMGAVMASRLLPFISFDLVSYAAGLTPLTFWRFALATFAGTLPSSFLLAHFGGEMASADPKRIGIAVILLGVMTVVTFTAHRVSKVFHEPQKQSRYTAPPS